MWKKSILFVSPVYVPYKWWWWVTQVALDYAKWLAWKWYNVTVATTLFDWLKKEESIDWIKILRFWSYSKLLLKLWLYNPKWLCKFLKKNIKKYDILFIHDIYTLYGFIAWKICRKNNKPYFIMPHWMWCISKQKDKIFVKKIFVKLFSSFASKNATKVIFCSENEKKDYEIPYTSWIVITNWIDQIKWTEDLNNINENDIDNFRKRYNLLGKKIIFSMWRLVNVKRFDKTILYLKDFLRKNNDYMLLLIWPDWWEMENLGNIIEKEWLSESVKIIPWLFWKDKTIIFKISKLFILSSDLEWFPIVICEAITSKIPCLLSEWCNVKWSKWFVEVFKNEEDFCEKLELLINKKNTINDDYYKLFDINNTIEKLDNIISSNIIS